MFSNNFDLISESLRKEKEERASRSPDRACLYANTFLDDCLWGIAPSELVVVGADTGVGKTEFVLNMALENAFRGKRVHLFSLEGSKNEAVSRLRWRLLCREYNKIRDHREWNYKKYLLNGVKTDDLDQLVDEQLLKASGLNIFNNHKLLQCSDLIFELGRIDSSDLIILDHLHYLSLDEKSNEAAQISEIVRLIKEITKIRDVPLVLVSHLRKKDRFRIFPDNEDFHGSSNIAKEADTCIMIWRDYEHDTNEESKTCFRVTKSRAGSEKRFIGQLDYDLHTRNYREKYLLNKITSKGLVEVERREIPDWAKNAGVKCQHLRETWTSRVDAED